jgi:hypothetical protein
MPRKEGYGDNPANQDPQIIDGERYKKPFTISGKAERKRTAARGKVSDRRSAKRNAIREALKKSKLIPASPTK